MRRAYKFLLRPTSKQAQALSEMLRDHCSLYNGALQERRDAYRQVSKTPIRYGERSARLKEIRAFDPQRQGVLVVLRPAGHVAAPRQGRSPRSSGGSRAGEKPGYPRFSWRELVRHG